MSQITPNTPKELWHDDSQGPSAVTKLFESLKADFTEDIMHGIDTSSNIDDANFDALMHQIKASANRIYSKKEDSLGAEVVREAERQIMLHVIDSKWVSHIHAMDSLKEGIHLQGYGQKDPLIEYKRESFDMFDNLLVEIRKNTVSLLYHAQIVAEKPKKTEVKASISN